MNREMHTITCDVCGNDVRYEPHRYNARRNQTYDIMVCDICYQANWDGWAPQYEDRVTRKLKERGVPLPQRNEHGLLPRE
jgi:hypothetical protein